MHHLHEKTGSKFSFYENTCLESSFNCETSSRLSSEGNLSDLANPSLGVPEAPNSTFFFFFLYYSLKKPFNAYLIFELHEGE